MKLRDYQRRCNEGIRAQIDKGTRSMLVVMPTGTGKTVIFGNAVKEWTDTHDSGALILAHREELIFQAKQKVEAIAGFTVDVEMGEYRAAKRSGLFGGARAIVSSVQTQNAGATCGACIGSGKGCDECRGGKLRRMQRFNPRDFGLLVIDECHHATAESYRRIIDYYREGNPGLVVLGVTATPDRHDETALGKIFDEVAFEYGVLDAINDGWLVPIHQEFVVCKDLDFSRVKSIAGDLSSADLDKVLTEERALHEITGPTIELAGDRATLVFATSVKHAELMAEILNRNKPNSAVCIHGATPREERRELLRRYSRGEYQYLCGCDVFLEGFDEPRIEVIAMARPTKSRALYAQAIGRGTRPVLPPFGATPEDRRAEIAESPKPRVHVLDFVGNSGRHKLISTADILGGNYDDEIVAQAVANAKKKGGEIDMRDELRRAEEDALAAKRRQRAAIMAKADFQRKVIDPFDAFDLTPEREPGYLQKTPPTKKQADFLLAHGIRNIDQLSTRKASKLIDEIIRRGKSGECSFAQARLLSLYGYQTKGVSAADAARQITEINRRLSSGELRPTFEAMGKQA